MYFCMHKGGNISRKFNIPSKISKYEREFKIDFYKFKSNIGMILRVIDDEIQF